VTQAIPNEPVLNELAWDLVEDAVVAAEDLEIEVHQTACGARILDFGVEAAGSLSAGITLAEVCTAGLAKISIAQGEVAGIVWPQVLVQTDDPVESCLLSQYAGWPVSVGDYFGMGSGPMRAAAAHEDVFARCEYREEATRIVGVLESGRLPGEEVVRELAETCGVDPGQVALLVAPTASLAGTLQIVARSVETALHKLLELNFDIERVRSAVGSAPLAPVAADDLTGIGRTNDAILYGARVTLWVDGDDDSLADIGPRVPASASEMYGEPFLSIFEAAGRDFYAVDKMLFSPAEIVIQNLDTGRVHPFGRVDQKVLARSFGLPGWDAL
jgi:methenyltetrahydromethanopterin cyclohydrolase